MANAVNSWLKIICWQGNFANKKIAACISTDRRCSAAIFALATLSLPHWGARATLS